MIKDLKIIQQLLVAQHPRTYLDIAPQDAELPFIVWTIPSTTDEELREDLILQIDIFDYSTDATAVEQLADDVDKALKGIDNLTTDCLMRFTRVGRLNIPDPDIRVRRRELKYLVKVFRVGGI